MTINSILHWLFLEKASFGAFGFEVSGIPALIFAVMVAWACSCWWVAFDATRRGKSGALGLLFAVLAGWPMSLVWWLWLRPKAVVNSFSKLGDSDEPLCKDKC